MAPHQRAAIRHAVRDLLIGQTSAGSRVHATRILPYRKHELPAISVYTLEESVDPESRETAPRELDRRLQLEVAGWVAPAADLDDAMDALALEIEKAMHADRYLGGTVADSVLDGTTMGLHGEGDSQMGLVTLTYDVTYQTLAEEAPGDLDDFLVADVTQNLRGSVHQDDRAQDEVVVQELP